MIVRKLYKLSTDIIDIELQHEQLNAFPIN